MVDGLSTIATEQALSNPSELSYSIDQNEDEFPPTRFGISKMMERSLQIYYIYDMRAPAITMNWLYLLACIHMCIDSLIPLLHAGIGEYAA